KLIRDMRSRYMATTDLVDVVAGMREETVEYLCDSYLDDDAFTTDWDADGLRDELLDIFNLDLDLHSWFEEDEITRAKVRMRIQEAVQQRRDVIEESVGQQIATADKSALLLAVDTVW